MGRRDVGGVICGRRDVNSVGGVMWGGVMWEE